jgi:hypothetical protein
MKVEIWYYIGTQFYENVKDLLTNLNVFFYLSPMFLLLYISSMQHF